MQAAGDGLQQDAPRAPRRPAPGSSPSRPAYTPQAARAQAEPDQRIPAHAAPQVGRAHLARAPERQPGEERHRQCEAAGASARRVSARCGRSARRSACRVSASARRRPRWGRRRRRRSRRSPSRLRILAAASMMLIDRAAPVPSPSRICRSKSGIRPSSSSTTWCPISMLDVAGQDVVHALVAEAHGGQRRGGADEAVHDDRHAVRGAAEEHAGHGGDLQPADLGQHVDRIARRRAGSRPAPSR